MTVTPATARLSTLEATVQLSAEVRDQNGQVLAGATVAWASDDAPVATVDASGLVTAVGNGAATITATAGGANGTATVTVAQEVSTVAVSPPADTLVEADTVRLSAEAADANGHAIAGAVFAWASRDTLVADVASYRLRLSGAGESGREGRFDGRSVRRRLRHPEVRDLVPAVSAVTTPNARVVGAIVEIVDGPDAGRQATTDDSGRYVLEAPAASGVHHSSNGGRIRTSRTHVEFGLGHGAGSRDLP